MLTLVKNPNLLFVLIVYWHWQLAQQLVCKGRVRKLEVSFVVEFQECRRIGMLLLEVHVVLLGLRCGVAAFFANVHLD